MNKKEQQEVLKNITDATLETLEKVGYDHVILIAIKSKSDDPDGDVAVLKGSEAGLAYMMIRLFERLPRKTVDKILEIITRYKNKNNFDK